EHLHLRFRDHRSALELAGYSPAMRMAGRFGSELNEVSLDGDLALHHWDQGAKRVLADRRAHLRLDMAFGGADGAFRITRGEVDPGRMPLAVTVDLTPTATGHHLELRANGFGVAVDKALALLPDAFTARTRAYDLGGTADVALSYVGPVEAPGPAFAIGARLTNGRMKERTTGTVLKDIQGELALDLTPEGVPARLTVKNFSARTGNGEVGGDWESTGLVNAPVKARLRMDMDLADLMHLARADTLAQVSGRVVANASVEGRLRSMADFRASDLQALRIQGQAALRNATMKVKGMRHRVEAMDADLALTGNDATVHGLKGTVQGSTLELRGTLRNLMPFLLFDGQQLAIDADATSRHIDLGTLLSRTPAGRADEKDYALTLPASIALDLRARVDKLTFEDFTATDIRGTLHMHDRVMRVAPVSLNTAGGAVLGRLDLDARSAPGAAHRLAIDADFHGIDVQQLFRGFQDFGQDFIGHRHLSGTSRAHVEFRAPLAPDMTIDRQQLTCVFDIGIDNGAIQGHQPLMDVAEHLRKNKLVSPFVDTGELERRLADVRFARLENRVEIRHGAVHIPEMSVRSNALDIGLSGTHWFDGRIDHHLDFRLSDLFRMGKPQRDEFGPIVDDGTGMRVFLHMYGTTADPQFANDGAMAAARRKQQFRQEKQVLRDIVREDLGLFRGRGAPDDAPATAGTGATPPPATPRFQVEWEADSATVKAGDDRAKPRKGNWWRERDKAPEEQVRFKVED
ncbi:MAG: AsmA-like C-terminal region-containing protein, partial [Flavobacteriales bacterium]|nr:AsmA-like C-terminal region-containing protein [Flavobacteriales bacterium]